MKASDRDNKVDKTDSREQVNRTCNQPNPGDVAPICNQPNPSNCSDTGIVKKVMAVFGTRPEAVKMCPLVLELKRRKSLTTILCVTGQHRQMLDQVLDAFHLTPDYDLSIMKESQGLFDITTRVLEGMKNSTVRR